MSPGRSAATDETVTIVPWPRSIIDGSTACVSAKMPVRFTATTSSHSFWLSHSTFRILLEKAALLTSTSTRPHVSMVKAPSARAASALPTSAERAMARPPAFSMSVTTASSSAFRRPFTTTIAPSAARSFAASRPMPVPEPVTIATWPSSVRMPTVP